MTIEIERIKILVFDAYGTLFNTDSVVEQCNRQFPGRGSELSHLWRSKQLEYTWLLSLMGEYREFWEVTRNALRFSCHSLGLALNDSSIRILMNEYSRLKPFSDTLQVLEKLTAFRLAILSNGSSSMLERLVNSTGLSSAFEKIFSVDVAKIYKPSPKAYQIVCDSLALEPSEIGFVSANSFDVIGAARFGLQTFWCNRTNTHLDELDVNPMVEITSLQALPTILSR